MPTVRQNIAYAYNGFMSRHRLAAVHLIKSALAIVLISLLLETFLFNINYFTSANYNTISLNDKLTLQETVDDQYKVTAVNHVLEFSNLNTEVHNIWLNFDYRQPAQDLTVKIQFTDDAHHTYFDSTEYTVGVPPVGVSTFSDQSEYINLNTTGLVKNLRIEIAGDDVSYPIKLSDIVLNAHHPFDFNTTRFFVCMGLLALAHRHRQRAAQVEGRHRRNGGYRGVSAGLVPVPGIESRGRGHAKLQQRLVGRQEPGQRIRGGR